MSKSKTKLINPLTGLMQCQVCQQAWFANIQPGTGHYYKGSWQCLSRCNKKQYKQAN